MEVHTCQRRPMQLFRYLESTAQSTEILADFLPVQSCGSSCPFEDRKINVRCLRTLAPSDTCTLERSIQVGTLYHRIRSAFGPLQWKRLSRHSAPFGPR